MKNVEQIRNEIVKDKNGEIDHRATAAAINPYFSEKYGIAASQWPENDETRAWHTVAAEMGWE